MKIIKLILAVLFLGVTGAQADVGMITQLSGDASVVGSGGSRAAVPFLKIANGDKITLSNGARLQVVYFGNGRQEIWKGSGQIEVGGLESKSSNNTPKPEVSQLPPLVVNQLAKTPPVGEQGKAGMVRVRSMSNPDAAAHLEKQYADLKRSAVEGDTTPEVYLLSGLVELKNFARAKTVLAELSGKTGYKSVVDHFTPLVNVSGK